MTIAPSPSPSPTPTPSPTPSSGTGSIVTNDIEYAQGVTLTGTIPLFLDIYQPDTPCDANRPTVMFVHGGGFRSGDKGGVNQLAIAMNTRGFNLVSINYRLLGDNPVPSPAFAEVRDSLIASGFRDPGLNREDAIAAAFEDMVAALNFLEANQDTYCADTSRLAYWGSSAGAFTALQVAYGLNQFDISRPEPRVVIDYWGNLIRDTDLEVGEAPFLVVHGTQDATVNYQDSVDLTTQANLVGIPHAFYTVIGGGHGSNGTGIFSNSVDGVTLFDLTADFIEAHLTGSSPVYRSVEVTP